MNKEKYDTIKLFNDAYQNLYKFTNKEKYNELIDKAYSDYCESFKDSIVEPHTKELFINKCKHNIEYSIRWGLKIEEKNLTRDERYDLMPFITGHTKEAIKLRKWVNGRTMPDGSSYHEEWIDSYKIPRKLITIIYNNETTEVYE